MLEKEPIPKYIVMEKSLIGNEIHEAGAVVPYDGLPADNLKPTDALGEQRRLEYIASNEERVRKMKAEHSESAVGDPTVFMAAFAAQLKADAEERDAKMAALVATAMVQAMAAFFPNGVPTAQPAPAAAAVEPAPAADAKAGKAKGADKTAEGLA